MKLPQESHAMVAVESMPPRARRTPVLLDHQAALYHAIQIADIVLLDGADRNELADATGRSRLDLPIDSDQTILNHWQRHIAHWMKKDAAQACDLRVLVHSSSPLPTSAIATADVMPRLERDPQECRGTGGLLRDIAQAYDDDQWLLVATGSQVLLHPLSSLIHELCQLTGDVRFLAHADGMPVGLMLVRCGCLHGLESIGFIDIKEQALPRIAQTHQVSFVMRKQSASLLVRTPLDYVRALRSLRLRETNPGMLMDPFAEDWRCAFEMIEAGAQVNQCARLHDAIILRGGTVDAQATVVRSIICPGAVVRRGQVVVDQLYKTG